VQVGWFTAYGVVSASALLVFAPEIDVLALGDDAAASLGVNVDRAGRRAYVVASLLAAATVAAAGLVGFVGLVVPHLVRARAGNRHRGVIAAAGLAGAALLVVADLAARTLRSPSELPLGAVTALAGVPFFLFQLRRYR
jgi:iron complex transport system permease protein